jgi:Dynein heavy chain, N-terminal region 2.
MKGVSERNLALPAATQPGLYKELKDYNVKLEQIQKALEDYLDKKENSSQGSSFCPMTSC